MSQLGPGPSDRVGRQIGPAQAQLVVIRRPARTLWRTAFESGTLRRVAVLSPGWSGAEPGGCCSLPRDPFPLIATTEIK